MEDDDAVRASGGCGEALGRARGAGPRAAPPPWCRYGRAEFSPTTWSGGRRVRRLGRSPRPLELAPRRREPRRERVREVVVARHGEHRRRRARRGAPWARSCSLAPAAVGQVARGDDELGLHLRRRGARAPPRPADPRVYPCGDRKHAGCVQSRANEAIDSGMADETAESLRRPLPRAPRRRRAAQAAARRAADDRGAGGARPLAAALERGARRSRSAASPSAPSGSASPSAASSSAAGARRSPRSRRRAALRAAGGTKRYTRHHLGEPTSRPDGRSLRARRPRMVTRRLQLRAGSVTPARTSAALGVLGREEQRRNLDGEAEEDQGDDRLDLPKRQGGNDDR